MNQRNKRGRGQFQNQRRHKNVKNEDETANENQTEVTKVFIEYQAELDARYDKYERLVKKSRDLTIESKRIIFLLHRVTNNTQNEKVLEDAACRLNDLFRNVIREIAAELNKREVYQYLRAFSPGLQEYVEAVSFYHYLKNGNLIHLEKVRNPDFLKDDLKTDAGDAPEKSEAAELPLCEMLTPTDFILGIADLTGELMRKCINSVASGNIEEPFVLCSFLQNIYEAFLHKNYYNRELSRKISTLRSSLQKVENACYAIRIRGSEIPKHMLADFFSNDDEGYEESANCDD